MAINKYDNPAIQPVRDAIPNVSALPFDAIAGSIKMREDTYNKNRAAAMEAQGALSVMGKALQVDQANRNKVLDSYDKNMKELVDSANGDYSIITEGIQDLIHSAKQDMTSGTLAAYGTSYANRNAEVADSTKKLQEEKHASGTPTFTAASKFKQDANFAYFNARGGTTVNPDGSYNTYEPTEMNRTVDTNTVLSQLVNGWASDGYIVEDNKGGWLVKEQAKGIPAIDVRSAATQQLYNQPGYQEMLKDEYMYKNSAYYMNDAKLKGLIDAGDMQGASQVFQVQTTELQEQRAGYIGNINADIAQLDAILKQNPNHKQALATKEKLIQRRDHLSNINLETVGGQEYFENIMYNDYAKKRTAELVEPYVSKIAYEELSSTKYADPYALMARKYDYAKSLAGADNPVNNTIPTVITETGSTQKVYDENELQKMLKTYDSSIVTARTNQATIFSSLNPDQKTALKSAYNSYMTTSEFNMSHPDTAIQKAYEEYIKAKDAEQESQLGKNRTLTWRKSLMEQATKTGEFTYDDGVGKPLSRGAGMKSAYTITPEFAAVMKSAFEKGYTPEEFKNSQEFQQLTKMSGALSAAQIGHTSFDKPFDAQSSILERYNENYEKFSVASKPTADKMNASGGYAMNITSLNNDVVTKFTKDLGALMSKSPNSIMGLDGSFLGDAIYANGTNKQYVPEMTNTFVDGLPVFGFRIPTGDGKFKVSYGTYSGNNSIVDNVAQVGNSMIIGSAKDYNGLKSAYSANGFDGAVEYIKSNRNATFTSGLSLVGSSEFHNQIGKLNTMANAGKTTPNSPDKDDKLVQIKISGNQSVYVGKQTPITGTGSNSYIVYMDGGKSYTFNSEKDLLAVLGMFKFNPDNIYTDPSITPEKFQKNTPEQFMLTED